MANIIPEPKVHPATTVGLLSEQQPISLTVTIIKQLEATVSGCILEHVYDVLDHQQYGLLNGQSTTHALVDVLPQWSEALDNGKSVRTLFVDYAKAFGHVDHGTVQQKLHNYGV